MKDESVVKEDPVKKMPAAKTVAKAPVLDMFADEEPKVTKEKKMPVYGSLKVEYDVDSDEGEDDDKEEEVHEAPVEPQKSTKPGPYSMFVKGAVMPGTKDKEPSNNAKSLSHYDVTLDDDSQESLLSQTNGDDGADDDDDDDDVVEMDVGDDIDIDQQLELALERKKVSQFVYYKSQA